MNMNLCPWNLPVAIKLSEVVLPSFVVAMGDAPGPYASTYPSLQSYSVVARHSNRVNLLFLGGQVISYAGSYVGCGIGDPKLGDVGQARHRHRQRCQRPLLKAKEMISNT